MSSDPGWWARKLGGQTQAPPQAFAPAPSRYPEYQAAPAQQQVQPVAQEPQVTTENLFEMAHYWTGGEAHRRDPYPCPSCGGAHYYSRSAEVSRGPAPAPMCFDCGFNGMFQQGDMATWQAGNS